MKSWRSVLSVPGHDARKVARAHEWGADHVFFDLEDSCPADRKAEARRLISEAHRTGDGVRIADAADLELVRSLDEPVIWIPKVEFPDTDVWPVCETGLPMVWLIESPRAVLRLGDLLATHRESLVALAFGWADFLLACGTNPVRSPELLRHGALQVVVAAKAHGIQASMGPALSLDYEEIERGAAEALAMGFDSMGAIHPVQVPIINGAFAATSHAEHLWATRVGRLGVGRPVELMAAEIERGVA